MNNDVDEEIFKLGIKKYYDFIYVKVRFEELLCKTIRCALEAQKDLLGSVLEDFSVDSCEPDLQPKIDENYVAVYLKYTMPSYATIYFGISFYPSKETFDVIIACQSNTNRMKLEAKKYNFSPNGSNECMKTYEISSSSQDELIDEVVRSLGEFVKSFNGKSIKDIFNEE